MRLLKPKTLSVLLGKQEGRRRLIGPCDDPDASAVPQLVGQEHARAVANSLQVRELVFGPKHAGVEVHMADDVVDWVLAGGRESVQSPRRGDEPSQQEANFLRQRHLLQRAACSGGTGIGMSVAIFHPWGVWIHSRTITNGLGTGSCPPYATVMRTGTYVSAISGAMNTVLSSS